MTKKLLNKRGARQQEDQWILVSDIMSGLMMVFLFIAIVYMLEIVKPAEGYLELKQDLYEALHNEFKNDLKTWHASIDRESLSFRFREPEIYFNQGSNDLTTKFKNILRDFFPRYLKHLHSNKFRAEIEEVRIEGYTSSEWANEIMGDEAYILNMELSQSRTRSVLEFALKIIDDKNKKDWLRKFLTANGLSSSKLILDKNGNEDPNASRRVEFRVRVKAESRIQKIQS